jgi:Ca2+-binding RTX toxin-like protein
LKQTGGGGALALKLVGSVEEVIYTAPVTVAASTLDAVSYTVTDQLGGTTTGSASVQLDAGPTIASVTPAVVEKGQSTEIGTVAAGLAGDMLTLKQTGGGGALALKLVGSVEEVIYTAPVTVAASTLDAVSYTVTDQLGGTATGSSTIPVASGTSSIIVGTAGHAVSAGNNNSVIDGRAGNETIQAGNGTDVVFAGPNDTIQAGNGNNVVLGGSSDKISLGNGNDTVNAGAGSSVSAGNGNDTITAGGNVTLGNGNDTVTSTGANSKITLGNGVDVVYAAANDTISLGNGNDTVYAGANDTISLGKGADTVAFGVGSSPAAFGNETVNSFSVHSDQIDLSLAQFVSYAAMMSNHEITSSGANTIITDGHGDNVTLTGVAPSSLSASNFRFS